MVVGKHPDLSHRISRDARRRQVRDTATRELEPAIGNVICLRKDGNSRSADLDRLLPDQPARQVDVMDHQLQHYISCQTAQGELIQPMRFDKARGTNAITHRADGRIEPFDLAYCSEAA